MASPRASCRSITPTPLHQRNLPCAASSPPAPPPRPRPQYQTAWRACGGPGGGGAVQQQCSSARQRVCAGAGATEPSQRRCEATPPTRNGAAHPMSWSSISTVLVSAVVPGVASTMEVSLWGRRAGVGAGAGTGTGQRGGGASLPARRRGDQRHDPGPGRCPPVLAGAQAPHPNTHTHTPLPPPPTCASGGSSACFCPRSCSQRCRC